ncbi:hypothetical protein [Shewanella atlantica]|uniref:hypothetical protein n=1 Tax=Shewanella atlantica TaxID=271099 RepID=UPI00163B3267|nr:hypothetical protein [Shewanella atlantica]
MNMLITGTNSGLGIAVPVTQKELTACAPMRCLNGEHQASSAAFVALQGRIQEAQ